MNPAEQKYLKKIKDYCAEMSQCYTCFLTDIKITLFNGLCYVCDDLISDSAWVKSHSTNQIEEHINNIKEVTEQTDRWITVLVNELTERKTENCQGCKEGLLNQQGHMYEGGCLYDSE